MSQTTFTNNIEQIKQKVLQQRNMEDHLELLKNLNTDEEFMRETIVDDDDVLLESDQKHQVVANDEAYNNKAEAL
jgi:hypothetical protein